MYGLLRLPSSAIATERVRYQRYMCCLCGTLHKYYGIRARSLVGYDCTTLALLLGSLDGSLDKEIMAAPQMKGPWCVLRPQKKSFEAMRFIAGVSVMLAYSKFFDRAIDRNKRIPKWIVELSQKASRDLSVYGLNREFFETKLEEQHKLEHAGCDEIELLNQPTAEILSRICGAAVQTVAKPECASAFSDLGFEYGKLLYVLDGLEDYQRDIRQGNFNCLDVCSLSQKSDVGQFPEKINSIIQENRANIAVILDSLELKDPVMIKRIFLQDFLSRRAKQATRFAEIIAQGLSFTLLASGSKCYPPVGDTCMDKFVGYFLGPLCGLCITCVMFIICVGNACSGRWRCYPSDCYRCHICCGYPCSEKIHCYPSDCCCCH